jgi:hypothetical protein
MSPRQLSLQTISDLRTDAAKVVALCDVVVYGARGDAELALAPLRYALGRLAVKVERTVAALDSEGIL